MSKIDELIAQYCPDGVEFKELKDIAVIGTGNRNGNEGIDGGEYPLYVRSKFIKAIDSYDFDEEAIIIPGEGGIGDIFHYVSGKYALHQRAYRIKLGRENILTKYVYYFMLSNFKSFIYKVAVNATVSSIRKPMIEKFPVPIPPLPVQEAIVEILDKFTALEARTRQYEYYRNELLSFDGKDVEWKMLKNVIELKRGTRVVKSQLQISGDIPVYQNSLKPLGYFNASNSDANSTYIICAGAAGDLGFSKVPFWAADDCFVFKKNNIVNSKFLYYFLKTKQEFLYSRVRRASIPRLSRESIDNIKIPLPSIEEQNRIVAILDKFDALVNDISTGLPAEIKARREQYEYYRAKLLAFQMING